MRTIASCVFAAAALLCVAAGAEGHPTYRDRLTFNDVALGGQKRLLSRHNFFALSQSLSPDRRHLAYVPWSCDGCGRTEVRIADVRSGNDRLLLQAEQVGDVAWSPDGRTIAVVMQRRSDERRGIWLVAPDGTNLREAPFVGGGNIAWSPDSRSLALEFPGSEGNSTIGVADVDSWATRWLDDGYDPQWSPNGRWVLFQYPARSGQPWIKVGPVTGGSVRRVGRGHYPVWSPNSRRIGFLRFFDDPHFDSLWVDSIYGGKPRRIAGRAAQMAPMWSPNGRMLAFARTRLRSRFCRANSRCEGLVVVPANGGVARLLARETRAIEPLAWTRTGHILYAGIIYPGG
jgi:Tol biopolymer transport system component